MQLSQPFSLVYVFNYSCIMKILLAVDFSENADNAIGAAKLIASKTGAALVFLHIYEPYSTDVSALVAAGKTMSSDDLENLTKQNLDQYVINAQNEGFSAEAIWEDKGKVSDGVMRKAVEVGASLIVVGRTGKGGFIDKLIGSSATKIALDAPCPVLVVPPKAQIADISQVIYATQLEYEETGVLRQVKELTNLFSAKLTLIKISSLEQPNIQPDAQFVDEITLKVGIPESDIIIHKGGGVVDGIEDYARKLNADLIVISRRDRSFFEEFIVNPSVTRDLVVVTSVPLLVYHLN